MAEIIRREPILNTDGSVRRHVPVVRCQCGSEVECDNGWSNQCERCETEYNGAGQTLAPRSQWGEETGETF